MAAPMSVKERIAMMKLKEEEDKAKTKTPEPPVRRSSIADKFPGVKTAVTPDSLVSSRLTAAEEIALTKKAIPTAEAGSGVQVVSGPSNKTVPQSPPPSENSANTTSYCTPPPPPPPSQRSSLAGVGPVVVADGESPALSIADRMAALRNNQNINNATSPPPPPPPAGAARRSSMPVGPVSGDMGLSVAERMAAMKTGNQPVPPPPPASVKIPNPPVPNSGAGIAPPPPPRPTTSFPPQPPQPNAVSSPPGPPAPPPPAPPRVNPPVPPPTPSSAPATPVATTSNGDNEAHNLDRTPSGRMTIAERMAALSSPSAVSGSASTQTTPGSTASRRVSVGLAGLGAKINLSALSPNAVRPPITPKRDTAVEEAEDETPGAKASRVSFTATAEDGEFRHLNLSRPAVPSVRRKQATASVRLQANVWDTADLACALGGSVATPSSTGTGTPRPSSLSSACTAPLPESDTSNTSLEAEADADVGSESQGRAIEEPIGTNDGATEPEAEETRVRTSLPIDRSNRASLL